MSKVMYTSIKYNMKKISKKEASQKYGVITTGVNSMYQYFLTPEGNVVDSDGDIRYMAHHHIYRKDRNTTRGMICECGHKYTPAT